MYFLEREAKLQFAKSKIEQQLGRRKEKKNTHINLEQIEQKSGRRKEEWNNTFLFNGRALNFGILAIISSSSSALLFTLAGRIRWDVSNSGSLGLVNVSFGFVWIKDIKNI